MTPTELRAHLARAETFADRLRHLRAGLSRPVFADMIGVNYYVVRDWEEGKGHPNFLALPRLAERLGCSLDWLIAGKGEPPACLASQRLSGPLNKHQTHLLGTPVVAAINMRVNQ